MVKKNACSDVHVRVPTKVRRRIRASASSSIGAADVNTDLVAIAPLPLVQYDQHCSGAKFSISGV